MACRCLPFPRSEIRHLTEECEINTLSYKLCHITIPSQKNKTTESQLQNQIRRTISEQVTSVFYCFDLQFYF